MVGSITDKSVTIAKYSLEDGSEIEKTLKLSTNYMSCISMNSILTCLDGENPVLYHMDVTKDNKLTKTSFEVSVNWMQLLSLLILFLYFCL